MPTKTTLTGRLGAATTAVLLFCAPGASADCPASFAQAFNHYSSDQTYSKDAIMRDFPSTRQPYKMVDGGDQGVPLTVVGDSVIKASFPKSALPSNSSLCCGRVGNRAGD